MKGVIAVTSLLLVAMGSGARADSDDQSRSRATETISVDKTKLLHREAIEVTTPNDGNHSTGLIDVSGYKTVRVVIERGACGPCGTEVRANVFSHTATDEPPQSARLDSFLIDEDAGEHAFATFASRAYDVPGQRMRLTFRNPSDGFNNQVIVLVFGRRN